MPIHHNWHPNPSESIPRHVVQVIPVDKRGRMLVIHRSNRVRSACNVWSFPSELHEIGETCYNAARRALDEELGLQLKQIISLGVYENIAGDSSEQYQYHWVINLFAGLVDDLRDCVNKEPDKHDVIANYPIDWFLDFDKSMFHLSLATALVKHRGEWYKDIQTLVEMANYDTVNRKA